MISGKFEEFGSVTVVNPIIVVERSEIDGTTKVSMVAEYSGSTFEEDRRLKNFPQLIESISMCIANLRMISGMSIGEIMDAVHIANVNGNYSEKAIKLNAKEI